MSTNSTYLKRLKEVECPDATYAASPALVLSSGKGSKLWDVEGKEYLDLCAGFGVMALGHGHPAIQEVLQRYTYDEAPLMHGMGDVYPTKEKILLLEKIKEFAPIYLTHTALALSGGQAVELALKTAMLATKAAGFIGFESGYHGLDLGLLGITAREDFRAPFKKSVQADRFRHLPYGADLNWVTKAVGELKRSSYGFAGIVVEPLQGRGGVRQPPDGWLDGLKEICIENDGLLIFDEVFTGFGRCGRPFFAEEYPCDLLCVGKALGGGMPLSACIGTKDVMNAWPKCTGEALHTGTFFGHPLSCAVATRVIEVFQEEDLVSQSFRTGEWFVDHLTQQLEGYHQIKEIRGQGLMIGIEFNKPYFAANLADKLRSVGLIVLPSGDKGQVLNLTPSLNIERADLEHATTKILAQLDS